MSKKKREVIDLSAEESIGDIEIVDPRNVATFKFALGQAVKDIVTGYGGVIIAQTRWLNGCQRYLVQARRLEEGKPATEQPFDESQLVAEGEDIEAPTLRPTGGPHPSPQRPAMPRRR